MSLKLWLDDERNPLHRGLEGWLWVKSVDEAVRAVKDAVERGEVFERASLDHDLGACDECLRVAQTDQDARECRHLPTGVAFVHWMVVSGLWPTEKPSVHSANPVGAANMRSDIDRWFGREAQGG